MKQCAAINLTGMYSGEVCGMPATHDYKGYPCCFTHRQACKIRTVDFELEGTINRIEPCVPAAE